MNTTWDTCRTSRKEVKNDLKAPSRLRLIDGLPNKVVDQLEVRAVVGHAQSGHRGFRGRAKDNANLNDIITQSVEANSISFDSISDFNNYSYRLCEAVFDNIENALNALEKKDSEKPIDLKKSFNPLWNKFKVLPLSFLQGFYFGGKFDNFSLRKIAENRYG